MNFHKNQQDTLKTKLLDAFNDIKDNHLRQHIKSLPKIECDKIVQQCASISLIDSNQNLKSEIIEATQAQLVLVVESFQGRLPDLSSKINKMIKRFFPENAWKEEFFIEIADSQGKENIIELPQDLLPADKKAEKITYFEARALDKFKSDIFFEPLLENYHIRRKKLIIIDKLGKFINQIQKAKKAQDLEKISKKNTEYKNALSKLESEKQSKKYF